MKIGIIGHGFVGKATHQLECDEIQVVVYDIIESLCNPPGLQISDMKDCKFILICVPTPQGKDGECVTDYVADVIRNIKKAGIINKKNNCSDPYIVVRSTVPVGFCDSVGAYFFPEFLTEKNYINDFINCNNWIIGSNGDQVFEKDISELFNLAKSSEKIMNNNLTFVSTQEAELIKYTRNCFLATKVAFFNEIQELCENIGVEYEIVRRGVISDHRIGESHTMVPGHNGNKGFGGHCLPKDISALNYFLNKQTDGDNCNYILRSVIRRNEHDINR